MLNKAILMGRLTRDPELRHTASNTAVASFTLAIDRDRKGPNGERQTDFIDVVAWRSTAEFVSKYFRKGQMIAVQGSIQTRTYEDKQGNKRKAVEVQADNVSFADSKGSSQGGQQNSSYAAPDYAAPAAMPAAPSFSQGSADDFAVVDDNEDLPF